MLTRKLIPQVQKMIAQTTPPFDSVGPVKRRVRGRWRVDWITKLGERRGCKNSEWYQRLKDAVDRERQLKRGGFECSIWDERPSQ